MSEIQDAAHCDPALAQLICPLSDSFLRSFGVEFAAVATQAQLLGVC